MTRKTINIEGMSCGHCVQWITTALNNIDGVKSASVSLETQSALVEFDEAKAPVSMLEEAVRKAGYTVTSVV